MHIDLDAFFVSVECARRPELKGKPVVVGGNPDRRGVVAASSYEARKFGIHSGMPLKTAVRLCPGAIFVCGSHAVYRDVSGKFMAILEEFSPFLEPVGIDEAYLDVTGFESLHGSLNGMAENIRRQVNLRLGITASVGIAGSKIVAKAASEAAKPDGVLEIAPGEEASFLAPLEIGRLQGIGKKTEAMLKGIGISTLGKLAQLPPSSLKARLGSYGETLILHARGIDNRPVEPPGEAKSISRETTFAEDVHHRKILEAMLGQLSEHVGARLRKRNRHARCITLKLRFSDFSTITRAHTLPAPTDADQVIFATGLNLMRKELAGNPLAVRLIGIGVSCFAEKGWQMDMLGGDLPRLENLNRALDRIRQKYGFDSISTGRTFYLEELFKTSQAGNGQAK
ncbi:MAG: DNA polymerase IV [Dehalococcoidaceae bacterium]|nr:DNA polymerase IV [Dehalococcoidaceae bacterium]